MDCIQRYASPLGGIILASDGKHLTGLWFEGQKHFPPALGPQMRLPIFDTARRWLDIYFDGQAPNFLPALAPRGTAFQQAVWEILLAIPYGGTMTYGAIAARLAQDLNKPGMSAQAVGGAVGRNPISIIIPCHRVVGADGGLTGYAGGLERKAALLALEKAKPAANPYV